MVEDTKQETLVMALFMVTKNSILSWASELGIPEEQVTDNLIELVKEKVSQSFDCWQESIKDTVKETIKKKTTSCPLGLFCSPYCAFRQVGECP